MSLSKEHVHLLVDGAAQPRRPKCARCRHHGLVIPKKGHTKSCPFLGCDCWKCYLITQRTRISALQRNAKTDKGKAGEASAAAKGTSSAPSGGGTSGGATGSGGPSTGSPFDLRVRPDRDSRDMVVLASTEKSLNPSYFGELGRTGPLPVNPFPYGLPGHYSAHPDFLLNMPWLPPVPAGLYNNNNGLCGPLMFPYIQPGPVHYPPPPEPGPPADCRQVFFTIRPPSLAETFQGELMSRQQPHPPPSKTTKQDVEE
ncbi:doublesex- and mab-3-related transcription factor B1-like [Mugil cephalus]|uniref:doublesex- and mab-3-related transcription factor B1-like n=1 Tax=Mugil cephalus TaxID=48193 RepID=UPI001FB64046|nr:doublesex- and mab-3-related transcription factor B1-like [Mugil cephalus]